MADEQSIEERYERVVRQALAKKKAGEWTDDDVVQALLAETASAMRGEPSRLERALALEPPEGWRRLDGRGVADDGIMVVPSAGGEDVRITVETVGGRSTGIGPVDAVLYAVRQALILRDGVDPLEPHDLTQVPAGATVSVSVAPAGARVQYRSREDVRITGTHTLPVEQFDGIVQATVNRGAIVYYLDERTEREHILSPVSGGWVLFYRGADGLRDGPLPSDSDADPVRPTPAQAVWDAYQLVEVLAEQGLPACSNGRCVRCRLLRAVADAEIALGLRCAGDASLGAGPRPGGTDG